MFSCYTQQCAMSEFKCNKFAGVYWPKLPLEDISIKIKLKSKESILALPKFEDYRDKTYEENLHLLDNDIIEEYVFKWQNKVFSKWEWQHYSDIYNCNTDTELKYHDIIKELDNYERKKVFTYIHEDYHLPLPVGCKKKVEQSMVQLSDCFSRLNMDDIGSYGDVSSSMRRLFRSEESIPIDEDRWMSMHIVLDSSEYNEDSQILYKEEHILVSLYHNVTQKYLIVTPNTNDIEFNAYSVENQPDIEYGVEIEFEKESETELVELLNSLLKKWEKNQRKLLTFVTPSLGRKNVFVTFEIVSAVDFDLDNLYIEFYIKIPDDLQCTGELHGRTHTSKCLTTDEHYEWKYGHALELQLESATGTGGRRVRSPHYQKLRVRVIHIRDNRRGQPSRSAMEGPRSGGTAFLITVSPTPDPRSLKIFLEAISVDWWGRHRTEGYSYLPLSLEPGEYERHLSCSRPEELDAVKANNRRFFVGGCHLIKDLEVLANPQLHNTNFAYTSTGTITVRWQTITQSQSGAVRPESAPSAPGRASALLSGAEAVLQQYRKAKATLTAATRSVEQLKGSGDG